MLKNKELLENISHTLKTLQNKGWQLIDYICQYDEENCSLIVTDTEETLAKLFEKGRILKEKNSGIKLDEAVICAMNSMERIVDYMIADQTDIACNKLEYEYIPILEVAYLQFEYWAKAYPDKERIRKFQDQIVMNTPMNRYIENAEADGTYKYDLSIYVVAYNKLDYTKQCVENILKNIPTDLKYELILFNHGSTDGTKEYFESVHPDKQIDITINGAVPFFPFRIYEGKYLLAVSNDVIITKNAIENMLDIVKKDEKIGWVVPSTPNVSNLQTIPAQYNTLEELEAFALKNNIRDPRRQEQRVRLCNPLTMMRSAPYNELLRDMYVPLCCSNNFHSFPDDKCSLWYRRNGYKLILAKDAYCHHSASQTLQKEIEKENEQDFYMQGRVDFLNHFGVDPWGTGLCFSPYLLDLLPCMDKDKIWILGINCGLGSNPLKIKETIKEYTGNYNVKICNYSQQSCYESDLKGVSDRVVIEKNVWGILPDIVKDYRYVVIEENLPIKKDTAKYLHSLLLKMQLGSSLCVNIEDNAVKMQLKDFKCKLKEADKWVVMEK